MIMTDVKRTERELAQVTASLQPAVVARLASYVAMRLDVFSSSSSRTETVSP